jgi:hypothetical protein
MFTKNNGGIPKRNMNFSPRLHRFHCFLATKMHKNGLDTDFFEIVKRYGLGYCGVGLKRNSRLLAGWGPRAFALVVTSAQAQVSYNRDKE